MIPCGDIDSVYIGEDQNNLGEPLAVFALSRERAGQGHQRRVIARFYYREDALKFIETFEKVFLGMQ